MPQMAALWWDILYMFFLASFILMSIMIYFLAGDKTTTEDKSNMMLTLNQMNWKW